MPFRTRFTRNTRRPLDPATRVGQRASSDRRYVLPPSQTGRTRTMVIMNSDKIVLPDNTGNVSVVTVDDELGKRTHLLARGNTAGAARAKSPPGVASSTRNSRRITGPLQTWNAGDCRIGSARGIAAVLILQGSEQPRHQGSLHLRGTSGNAPHWTTTTNIER